MALQAGLPDSMPKRREPDRYDLLKPYLIHIRPLRGKDIEQYWIDDRSKIRAVRRAARLAGVSTDRVISAERFRWSGND